MAQRKRHPLRINLGRDNYDLLVEALKISEVEYGGDIAADARTLREKIEKHARYETDEEGKEVFRLGFYEKEGEQFIFQFLAMAQLVILFRGIDESPEDDVEP